MPVIVQQVGESCKLGEAPHWDVETQSLYYVDISGKTIHKYTPSSKKHSKVVVETDLVSFVIPVEGNNNKYLIGIGREVVALRWDGISDKLTDIQKIAEVDTAEYSLNNRINDAKCDASGRLWCGTLGRDPQKERIVPNIASFYSVNPDGKVKHHLSNISVSNGLAWNSDNTQFYYIDSFTREIHQYDFDLANESISNKKVVFSLEEVGLEGHPDGQTIDADGNLWVALYGGYKVIKVDPRNNNTLLQTIDIPTKEVTSVAFGGPYLDELYVTTASFSADSNGALYKITGLCVKGNPGIKAKLF